MRPGHGPQDPVLEQLVKHDQHHDVHQVPHEFPTHYGYDSYSPHHQEPYSPHHSASYSPHHPEWPVEAESLADESAEYDYFAGMFSKPKALPKPADPKAAAQAKAKATSLPPMKQPTTQAPQPPAAPVATKPIVKPTLTSKPGNELYGDRTLPEVPPATPCDHDPAHCYWDKQYAQAEYATEMLHPHDHPSATDYYHHYLNEDEGDLNEYLALYGASELFG